MIDYFNILPGYYPGISESEQPSVYDKETRSRYWFKRNLLSLWGRSWHPNNLGFEYYNNEHYINGNLIHREDGPAIHHDDGSMFWIFNGKLHRENGPAIEYIDGRTEYWLNGERLNDTKVNFYDDNQTNNTKEETKEIMYSKTEQILRQALEEAKEKITEQDAILKQLMESPTTRGYVISVSPDRVIVSMAGDLVEVLKPDSKIAGVIKSGDVVRMLMDPPAIIDIISNKDHADAGYTGEIVLATNEGNNGECQVEFNGATRAIRFGSHIKNPEVGDRLLVDASCRVAIKNLGPDESKFSFQGVTGVTWDQIGGLNAAKEILKEAIELPFKFPDLYKKYNKKIVKGVLLYGPPGCGKTLLAKAAATAISSVHNQKQVDTGFIYVKGPEMLDKFVGNTEAQVRSLFARARKHQKNNGYPAIIFIDEADAILGKRDSRPGIGIESTVVPQFLAEMDGLDETGAMVLLATNRPNSLDSAVTRDGRIDRKVRVTRPDLAGTEEIFNLYLDKLPLAVSKKKMAKAAADILFSNKYVMYNLSVNGSQVPFLLGNMVNGAMIAGMVDKATTIAMRKEMENKNKDSRGITIADLQEAADSIYNQNFHLNHEEEILEFTEVGNLQVNDITKAPQTISI